MTMTQSYSQRHTRRKRIRSSSSNHKMTFRSIALATALFLSSSLLHHKSSFLPSTSLRMNSFSGFQIFASAKEIVATKDWQLLGENDTIPAGLHIRMDMTTGEKWVKLPSDDDAEGEESIKAAIHEAEMDASGALTIVETDNDNDSSQNNLDAMTETSEEPPIETPPQRDYGMMHRVMSQLPPEELERYGGLPALPSSSNETNKPQLTQAERELFEQRMEQLWQERQEALAEAQEQVADLPSILKDRIRMLKEYVEDDDDDGGKLKNILQDKKQQQLESDGNDEDEKTAVVRNVLDALRDLEFQLGDVDMARDFHTLGGWPYLVSLLEDGAHGLTPNESDEELLILTDEIKALAAMTIGTAVGNLGEFRDWALEDVSSALSTSTKASALSVLIDSVEHELSERSNQMNGGSMAVTSISDARYKSRAIYKLRVVYALGSLLRGNPAAQHYFLWSTDGAELLARDVLGTLSSVRGPSDGGNKALTKLDYKFASKVLALGEDIVTGAVLHQEDYEDDRMISVNRLVAAFTTERWCDLSLRMLAPSLAERIGETASRGTKERALTAVRALGPGCREMSGEENWGVEEVTSVRSEWNREGSDDGLDSVYRRELLELADGVLGVLQ
eukprot:CAMPEP_0183785234 /NCGR_PEP_ID=MMETSP0739-20130205/66394_1 /TAXON_ID=385413 /ORGANISM="Thalassiosira miniscula, Strain CCMP1093" /LENGTH=619 /DNA_ID=CAMNT_0026029233 /DNA_START=148 /DNA_END=2007 /DNA_ORIENTATION=+